MVLVLGWFHYLVVIFRFEDRAKQLNLCTLVLLVLPLARPVARYLIAFGIG